MIERSAPIRRRLFYLPVRFLRWWQRSKTLEACAWPGCTNEWHCHVDDVRLCEQHSPRR